MAQQAEQALLAQLPERDGQVEWAARIVQEVMHDRSIVSVEQISGRHGMSSRQLQRLFRKYVGVTPKWVIRRFRLQEAAERIERNADIDWADLAAELGY